MPSKTIIISIVVLVVADAGLYFLVQANNAPSELDGFAQCLTEKGAIFYGAFWCPHCQNQKALFGRSAKFLNYVECSTPDGRSQTQVCKDTDVKTYPTWQFADSSRQTGEVSLQTLADKTSCQLP